MSAPSAALALLRSENHVSVSSINTYIKCPQQYFFNYILRIPKTHKPAALAFGSAIHEALALFYKTLMKGNPEPKPDEIQTAFRDEWKRQIDGELPILLDGKDTQDSLVDKGTELVAVFHKQAQRPHKVIGVEEPFSIEILDSETGEVLPERLVGAFDAVVQNKDGSYSILEHKTAARQYTQLQLDHDLQVTAYACAASLVGLQNATVNLQVLLKTKQPKFETYKLSRGPKDIEDLTVITTGILRAISAQAFYPVRSWVCSGCQFASQCLAG